MEREAKIRQMDHALHALCQPLTALQCGLEVALLADTVETYREEIRLGLEQCVRIATLVESMRAMLQEVTT